MKPFWIWTGALGALALTYAVSPGLRSFVRQMIEMLGSNDIEAARTWVAAFGVWGPAVILAFMLLQTLLPVLPSVGVMVVATLAYGPLAGGVLAWVGLMLAATLGYGMGRGLGEPVVLRLAGERNMTVVRELMDRYGVRAVVAARLSPLISTDAVSIVAGMTRMNFGPFMVATALGTLPLTVVVALLARDFRTMGAGLTVLSVVTLLALSVYVAIDRRRSRSSAVLDVLDVEEQPR